MNSKTCKALRMEANIIAMVGDNKGVFPYIDYNFKNYSKVYTDLLTGNPKQYTVYTAFMVKSERLVYKQLKKAKKNSSPQG